MQEARQNITLNDVQLAEIYYRILHDFARQQCTLTYGQLVSLAKELYPENAVVQAAIAVSTGRKLEVIRIFTNERELPDLTSLVVSGQTGECGDGFLSVYDPEAARNKVFAYDWPALAEDFSTYVSHTTQSLKPRKRRSRASATKVMSEHYTLNKSSMPSRIKEVRDVIIELLMEGLAVEEAFAEAQESLSA